MREPVKRINIKSLAICNLLLLSIFLVEIICAYAFVDDFSIQWGPVSSNSDDPSSSYADLGVELDPHAVNGMTDPSEKTGVKKPYGEISYKINPSPQFKNGKAEGNLLIENNGDNQHFMRVRVETEDGDIVYYSGFLAPDMHIPSAPLDVELEDGTYPCKAYIEAYDMDTLEKLGEIDKEITLTIGK